MDGLGDVDPHGHRWEFASWVVAGDGVDERTYRETRAGDPGAYSYFHFDYERPPGASGQLNPTGRQVWLQQTDRRVHRLGEINACPLEVVHTVCPVGAGLVATVLVQGNDRSDSTKVFSLDEHKVIPDEDPLEVEDLKRLFDRVLDAMGRPAQHGFSSSAAEARSVSDRPAETAS
jgi:hypothetical protein